jgi:hypothetical protein
MKRVRRVAWIAITVFLGGTLLFAASRPWQQGKLVDTEQQKERTGSTTFHHTDGQAKAKGNGKANYSENGFSNTSEDTDTYEVYTIQGPEKTYIAREKLMFPWSKPAKVTVGDEVKYAIDGRKLYILDEDGKEHKASVVKASLNSAK